MGIVITRRLSVRDNFEIISRVFLRDARLSFKARGLGAWLMTHQAGFTLTVTRIAEMNDCGESQVRAGLNELISAGYLIRGRTRNDAGQLGDAEYVISDFPVQSQDVVSAVRETPVRETPVRETEAHKESTPKEYHSQGEEISSREDDPAGSSDELDLGLPPKQARAQGANKIVAAYVEAFFEITGHKPVARDKAKIGMEAKRLLADGVPVQDLAAAAGDLGRTKFTDLATAYRERLLPVVSRSKGITTDERVHEALSFADPAELQNMINPFAHPSLPGETHEQE